MYVILNCKLERYHPPLLAKIKKQLKAAPYKKVVIDCSRYCVF